MHIINRKKLKNGKRIFRKKLIHFAVYSIIIGFLSPLFFPLIHSYGSEHVPCEKHFGEFVHKHKKHDNLEIKSSQEKVFFTNSKNNGSHEHSHCIIHQNFSAKNINQIDKKTWISQSFELTDNYLIHFSAKIYLESPKNSPPR